MNTEQPLTMLGGLTAGQFMKRHWQKKPLLVRQAFAGFKPLLTRAELFALAGRDDVESRLLVQGDGQWKLRRGGPLPRRALPALTQSHWTLLVQGVDLHDDGVHALMQQFRFVPDARLDDLMISYATDQGGVGPHFDSYDVFLLQAHGQRRWRIGRNKDKTLVDGLPLKILAHFEPEQEYLTEPGDLLYLPPGWAHDGVALGECMTYSIGFRQPDMGELARELLSGLAEEACDALGQQPYRDPRQPATATPAAMPAELLAFAQAAVQRAQRDPGQLALLLGEYMTSPKPNVWFEAAPAPQALGGVVLDRRTRMMYDEQHVFINGEGFRASGRDARLMRELANQRQLAARASAQLSPDARQLLMQWVEAGWLQCSTAA